MIRAVLLVLVVGFFAVLALAVAAFTYFGVMGVAVVGVAAIVAVPVALKLFGGRLFAKALRAPFKMKGAPLRDARVRVHAVRRAAAPAPAGPDDDEAAEPREWYTLELTVVPPAHEGPFQHWNPLELMLVDPADDPDDPDDDLEWGVVRRGRVWRDGAWAELDESLAGEQRVRLLVGLRPGPPRSLRFRYYLELFGHVDLQRARV